MSHEYISTERVLLFGGHAFGGINVNLKVLSGVFLVLLLISNFAFSIFGVVKPYYILCNGVILFVFVVLWLKLAQVNL